MAIAAPKRKRLNNKVGNPDWGLRFPFSGTLLPAWPWRLWNSEFLENARQPRDSSAHIFKPLEFRDSITDFPAYHCPCTSRTRLFLCAPSASGPRSDFRSMPSSNPTRRSLKPQPSPHKHPTFPRNISHDFG